MLILCIKLKLLEQQNRQMGPHFCEETKGLFKNNRTPSWSKFHPQNQKHVYKETDGGRGEELHPIHYVKLWDPFLVVNIQVQSSNQPNLKK